MLCSYVNEVDRIGSTMAVLMKPFSRSSGSNKLVALTPGRLKDGNGKFYQGCIITYAKYAVGSCSEAL